ncbi:hypothetical protein AVEN_111245-1 [Araneus ventricosus]|uniref:Uncharacterized protein n=1 Tax=Araneus ventricosus TaxID=182803 RepID=A0A4Y2SSX9_ARAVE|nr:hypothetical protein AVEN_111245-1 [Araneus ventricosus]
MRLFSFNYSPAPNVPSIAGMAPGNPFLGPHVTQGPPSSGQITATRAIFWDGPRSFEPRSDDEGDTSAGTPSQNFRTTPAGGHLVSTDLACTRPICTAVLR